MKYFLPFLAFVVAHLICGWIAWAGGMDLTTRGAELQLTAWVALCAGAYSAFVVSLIYKDKVDKP